MVESLVQMKAEQRGGNRGGRNDPTAVKRRQQAYAMFTIPRRKARAKVKKNGHPKKLK
jgi:hypothetical protein